jgi:hypothetical protein
MAGRDVDVDVSMFAFQRSGEVGMFMAVFVEWIHTDIPCRWLWPGLAGLGAMKQTVGSRRLVP